MRFACITSVAALVLFAGAASADDVVPNPEFANWSKFKKGTSVTLKTTTATGGFASETLSTSTLVEVSADKVVVEYVTVTKFNGMEVKAPAAMRDIPKTLTLPKGVQNNPDPKVNKEVVSTENGTETIKVNGAEYKTKWTKNKVDSGDTKSESKVWMCDDVPGMMVKMETTVTGAVASTIKMELVEFKK